MISANQIPKKQPYLGILQNNPPPAYDAASSDILKFDSDGVVLELKPDRTESRFTKFARQSASKKLLPKSRVNWCLRRVLDSEVKILKSSHGTAHYSGLMVCGKPWECPVCAAKIAERRRNELVTLVDAHKAQGGSCLLLTFTFSHTRFDDLNGTIKRLSKSWSTMTKSRAYRSLMSDLNVTGSVRAFEVTWGNSNGWHPHYHVIWFLDSNLSVSMDFIKAKLFSLWLSVCTRFHLGIPSFERGVDVRNGDYAAKYAAKFGLEDKAGGNWSIADELAMAHTKNGRNGHYSPFQLLDLYISGHESSGSLFREYVAAFSGSRQLVFSKGLKSRYEIKETTDEELAVLQDDSAVLLGSLTLEQWRLVLRNTSRFQDSRAIVLTLAENGGMDAVNLFLREISIDST